MPNIETTLYYANWCGHCAHFEPHWDEFAKKIENIDGKHKGVNIVTKKYEEGVLSKQNIKPTINNTNIRGYPTVKISIENDKGKKIEYEYNGKRNADSLYNHITVMAVEKLNSIK